MMESKLALDDVRHADIAGGRLAYSDTGSGEPLVFLHGGGLDHRMWNRQIEEFSQRYRVIAPDARGHGRSSTPVEPFRHCDDIAALLEHLGLGPVGLVGLSMGATTALDTALEHPHLVSSLVISGAGTSEPRFTDPWTLEILSTWQRTQEAGDAEGWIDAFMLFTAGPHRDLGQVDPQVVAQCRQMVTETVAAHVRTDPANGKPAAVPLIPVENTWQRLPEITADLHAIVGGLDTADHIGMAEQVARTVPNGSSTTVDGTAHYPNMERPAEFNAVLSEFLHRVR
ncbi:alpha/beta hydrolase [Saccharopolyspora taberi]|uniref:Alpha/beta hydrolase n=1 Tax=Saccharopolyspora taberi TaxID=60895 RepID=A0ABN3V9I2_9PSEU